MMNIERPCTCKGNSHGLQGITKRHQGISKGLEKFDEDYKLSSREVLNMNYEHIAATGQGINTIIKQKQ